MTRRSGKAPTQRQLRVGEEIRHALAEIIARADFRDPDLIDASISVSEVRVSPDLRNATVFVSDLGGNNTDAVVKGLNRASGHVRHEYSRQSTTKYIPKFSFKRDESLDEALKINKLLQDPKVQADIHRDDDEEN
ncbi:30S ribosome-binding factor RbfA [Terasakiella sp. A23]|uniref:30S ribosome-binding factor RbfA n=1 Tax=Terasakiella sp. FCG-A23 TaxID=3080561 RepID=UPI0029547AA6|nr:30S ribosome-binding factor RbfA [Terasakiella sp. A23]MDV7337973.1 30S ribosome-binding factor RbfA [Terasakiella sp. A23]